MTNDRCWVRSVLTSGLVLFGLFPVVPGTAPAQERTHVAGQVQDSSTRNPLPGVRVTVVGTAVGVMTDASGRYALDVPAGRDPVLCAHRLQARGPRGRAGPQRRHAGSGGRAARSRDDGARHRA